MNRPLERRLLLETTGELLVSGRVDQAIEVKPSTFWKITIPSTENRAGPDNLLAALMKKRNKTVVPNRRGPATERHV